MKPLFLFHREGLMEKLFAEIKKYNFLLGKSFERKELFWVLLGPSLLILSLLLGFNAHVYSGFALPIIAIGSLFLPIFWREKGLFVSLISICICFGVEVVFGSAGSIGWALSWFLSLFLSSFIAGASLVEIDKIFFDRVESYQKKLANLISNLDTLKSNSKAEKDKLEDSFQTLQTHSSAQQDEIASLKRLIDATLVESQKMHRQNQDLITKTLSTHEKLKRSQELEKAAAETLQKLNYKRVESFQRSHLIDALEKENKKLQDANVVGKVSQAVEIKETKEEPIEKANPLEELEAKKEVLKSEYEVLFQEATELKKNIESLVAKDKKLPIEEKTETDNILKLQKIFAEKKQVLVERKQEIVSIERDLYIQKKELQTTDALYSR